MSTQDIKIHEKMREIASQLRQIAIALQNLADLLVEEKKMPDLAEILKQELGIHLQHVEVMQNQNQIQVRPKQFLEIDVFRSIANIARKQGGRWGNGSRSFIISLNQ